MRNLKTKILIAGTAFALTFAFGVSAWKRQPLSLCTATEYRLHYQPLKGDNYVNLKGYLYGGKFLSFGDTKLNGCEGSAAEVVLADESKLTAESQELIRELNRQTYISEVRGSDEKNKYTRAEVELIGTLSEREQYCFTSRYVITALEITPT
ncbi:MAG: hypothetical protein LH472_13820, partial [Pyrinomonadaceae bacterium]|nr:hypothetical protein [Pyrinomonadaceae bacterium]